MLQRVTWEHLDGTFTLVVTLATKVCILDDFDVVNLPALRENLSHSMHQHFSFCSKKKWVSYVRFKFELKLYMTM